MYDTRLRLANQVVEEVRVHFQDLVLKYCNSQKYTSRRSAYLMVNLSLHMMQPVKGQLTT